MVFHDRFMFDGDAPIVVVVTVVWVVVARTLGLYFIMVRVVRVVCG